MRIFFFFVKTRILATLYYKFNIVFMILSSLFIMLVNISIWQSLYADRDIVYGITLNGMVIYTILSTVFSSIFYTTTAGKMAEGIRSGSIAYDLNRPFPYLLRYFGEDIGEICSSFLLRGIPMLVIASFLFTIPLPINLSNFLLFIISLGLCYCILWLIDAIFGILNFWTLGFGNMSQVAIAIVRVLSGSFVPLWFFPDKLQTILYLTPFPYSYQSTISIYIGRFTWEESIKILLIQLLWIGILLIAMLALYKKANRKIVVQGG